MPESRRKKRPLNHSPALPDLQQTKSAVLITLTSKSTRIERRIAYRAAMRLKPLPVAAVKSADTGLRSNAVAA